MKADDSFAADADGRALLDQGKRFWDPKEGKYAGHKDAVFDTVQTFFTAYAGDELNVQLGEDVKKLTKDLLMDSEGNVRQFAAGCRRIGADGLLCTVQVQAGALGRRARGHPALHRQERWLRAHP